MDAVITQNEQKDKKKGMVTSIVIHVLLFLIAILPLLTFPDPPPGQEGILVNLGIPDVGEGDENAAAAADSSPAEPEESEPEVVETETEPEPVQPEVSEPEPTEPVEKEVVTTEDPEAIALKKKKEEEAKKKADEKKKKAEEEARKKAEAEAKRKAEEERKRKEAEEKRKYDEAKSKFGGLFGSGEGKGNTGKPGNQGDPNGDPNSDVLEGISTGSGKVGGGLGSRGILSSPKIRDTSQKTGRVVVKVCVDNNGKVISADYTQKGSTTTNSRLKEIAISNARKYKFSKSQMDRQCGTITYDFKVK